jgi:hypothetical protein
MRRGDGVSGFVESLGMAAHAVGNFDAGFEPCGIVIGRLVFQQAADLVEFSDFRCTVWRQTHHVEESRRPAVVSGKVHEIG